MSSQFYNPITYYVEQLFFVNLPRYCYLQYIHIPSTNNFEDSTSMIVRAFPTHVQFIFMSKFFFETRTLNLSVVSIKLKKLFIPTEGGNTGEYGKYYAEMLIPYSQQLTITLSRTKVNSD